MSAQTNALNVAVPIAHRVAATGSVASYADYYDSNHVCAMVINRFFNQNSCDGFEIITNPSAQISSPLTADQLALYAPANGSLSYQNHTLVFRFRRETSKKIPEFQSADLFRRLQPVGGQLRYVIYQLSASDEPNIRTRIGSLLDVADHAMRTHQRIRLTAKKSQTLGQYLSTGDPQEQQTRKDNILTQFMSAQIELMVQAGDLIGDFVLSKKVLIKMLDSCGAANPTQSPVSPLEPFGRPINPAYFLSILLSTQNVQAGRVNLLTSFDRSTDVETGNPHPLLHLFRRSLGGAQPQITESLFDLNTPNLPKPLQVSTALPQQPRIIQIGGLGQFHESRNAADPYNTKAKLQWRIYGSEASDTDAAQIGRLIVKAKSPQTTLPAIDAQQNQINRFQQYWQRYATIINAVASAFEIPCEFLLAFAMKETGAWFGDESDVSKIRLEPLKITPGFQHQNDPDVRAYAAAAGNAGIARTIPIPWSGGQAVRPGSSTLTWEQLAQLTSQYPDNIRCSPAIIQTLVGSARGNLDWLAGIYGSTYISTIQCVVEAPDPANPAQPRQVILTADTPPNNAIQLLSTWFSVAVDRNGVTNPAAPDPLLSRRKRALHGFIGGAAHIKRNYNDGSTRKVTDFDPPTVASGYNDGAGLLKSSVSDARGRYGMIMRAEYAEGFPIIFNSAVAFLNSAPAPTPSVRLGK